MRRHRKEEEGKSLSSYIAPGSFPRTDFLPSVRPTLTSPADGWTPGGRGSRVRQRATMSMGFRVRKFLGIAATDQNAAGRTGTPRGGAPLVGAAKQVDGKGPGNFFYKMAHHPGCGFLPLGDGTWRAAPSVRFPIAGVGRPDFRKQR